jgi:hypothetical protein
MVQCHKSVMIIGSNLSQTNQNHPTRGPVLNLCQRFWQQLVFTILQAAQFANNLSLAEDQRTVCTELQE